MSDKTFSPEDLLRHDEAVAWQARHEYAAEIRGRREELARWLCGPARWDSRDVTKEPMREDEKQTDAILRLLLGDK